MSRVEYYCWKCDFEDCGHVWLAMGLEPPEKCAKCRRRKWNKDGQHILQGKTVGKPEKSRIHYHEIEESNFPDAGHDSTLEPIDET